ncbi:hypothetical protein HQ535_12515 [bacterium]|nr:hypothetical protein [bacterium]
MTEDRADHDVAVEVDPDEAHPRGAFFLTLGFIGLIIVVWGYSYAILIGRG